MNRLIPIFAALVVLAGPLAVGGVAQAKDHDSDRRAERGQNRGGEENRARGASNGREDRGERRDYESEERQQFAPSPRRGGFLPPQAGGVMPDYGRYRLRAPPRGFVWVRTGNGFAMVSQETGQVFDVVPN